MAEHDDERAAAIQRLKRRRELNRHLIVYALVNALLVVIWAASGAGYFWPIWPIAGWGFGIALHAWTTYGQRPISEEEIAAETRRGRGAT